MICTDIAPHSLEVARAMGCDAAIDVSAGPQALAHLAENRGRIDVAFECSGAPGALAGIVPTLRPKGRMVIVGLGGDVALPMNTVVVKEIEMVGTFRFDDEFGEAAAIIGQRLIDFRPMITAVYPMADAVAAFGIGALIAGKRGAPPSLCPRPGATFSPASSARRRRLCMALCPIPKACAARILLCPALS